METQIELEVLIGILAWRMMPTKGVKAITTAQLKSIINDKDKFFIDVCTQGEYKARGLQQFKNLPLGSAFSKLPKDKDIVEAACA